MGGLFSMQRLQSESLESGCLVTSDGSVCPGLPLHWGLQQKLLSGTFLHIDGWTVSILAAEAVLVLPRLGKASPFPGLRWGWQSVLPPPPSSERG